MKKLVVIFRSLALMLLLYSCGKAQKAEEKEEITLISQDSVLEISRRWKEDSLGCKRQRDPKAAEQLISQLNLIGKDSSTLFEYLGKPDMRVTTDDRTSMHYHLACGFIKEAGYIFTCSFKGDSLLSVHYAILN